MQPASPTLPAHVLADTLLSEWEHRTGFRPAPQTTRPHTLAQLAALCELALTEQDVNIDAGDIRTTLATAASFGIATAAAAWGPGRAARIVAALQLHHYGPTPADPVCNILLSITSAADDDCEMDELICIIEYIRNAHGEDAEMIFGHGQHDDAATPGVRVHLLLGYGAPI